MIEKKEVIRILRRMKLEHGPTVCLGCGHEHNCSIHGCAVINDAIAMLQLDAPTVDAVPVVRCKECMWWKYNGADDALIPPTCYDDNGEHFCSYGERKDGAE